MSETFLYAVHPTKTITGIEGVGALRTPKSVYLTKEDVYKCLKLAHVYRRFANDGLNERVTIDNVDRLHRAEHISEEDWPAFLAAEKAKGSKTVVETTAKEEPKKEEKKVEPKKEAPVVEKPVEEPKKEVVVEELKKEAAPVVEEKADEVVEEVVSDDEEPEEAIEEATTEEA